MRHLVSPAVVIASCVALNPLAAQTQPPTPYVKIFCVKVQPGKDSEWRKLMTDVSKPTAQARADAGEFSSRILMRAVYPAGMDAACDYRISYAYPGFPPDPKSAMSPDAAHQKAHVAMSSSDFYDKRDSLTRLRRAELWRVMDTIKSPEAGDYVRLDFMKVQPDQRTDWLKNERETYKAIHQANIDLGVLKAWAVFTLAMPSGSALPYNAMTANVFKDWPQLGAAGSKYAEAFKKAHPDMDMAQTVARGQKLRDLVGTELYEVVDVIRPAH